MGSALKQRKLDARERRFVGEYLIDLAPERAALAAGYAKSTAHTKAYMWVSNGKMKPHVYEAIQAAMALRAERVEITSDRVLEELGKIGFANTEDFIRVTEAGDPYIDLSDLSREQAAAISEVSVDDYMDGRGKDARQVRRVRVKFHDKKGALESIGKHLGMFKTQVEVSSPGGGPVAVDDLSALTNEQLEERLRILRGEGGEDV